MPVQSISDIKRTSQLIEDFLRNYLKGILSKHSPNVILGSRYNEKLTELEIRGHTYEVRVGENIRNSEIIEVALVERSIEAIESKSKPNKFQLSGHGRYKSANIWLPDEVEFDREWFSEATDAVFQTGYRWLEEQVRIITSQPEVAVGIDLYAYLRSIINNEKLLDNIWFGCSIKGRGVFLLDPTIAMSGLNIISSHAAQTGDSALRLIAEYLGCDIPAEKTFGTIAVGQNKCMDFELSTAKYWEDLPLFLRAQAILMKSKSITVFPIFKGNSDYLQCVFPTEKKVVLLPILLQHREELSLRFARSRKHLIHLLKIIRAPKSSLDASAFGSFVGGFSAGFVKEMSKL